MPARDPLIISFSASNPSLSSLSLSFSPHPLSLSLSLSGAHGISALGALAKTPHLLVVIQSRPERSLSLSRSPLWPTGLCVARARKITIGQRHSSSSPSPVSGFIVSRASPRTTPRCSLYSLARVSFFRVLPPRREREREVGTIACLMMCWCARAGFPARSLALSFFAPRCRELPGWIANFRDWCEK